MKTLDSFETALLTHLRDHVEPRNQAAAPPSSKRRVVIGVAAAVAAGAALSVAVPQLGTEPAFSVQEGNTGLITVEVNRPENAVGLEAELAKYGIAADITYLAAGQGCDVGRYTPVDRPLSGMQISVGAERLEVQLPPGTVRDGETFVMALSGEAIAPSADVSDDGVIDGAGYRSWTTFDVTAGPVQPCEAVPFVTE